MGGVEEGDEGEGNPSGKCWRDVSCSSAQAYAGMQFIVELLTGRSRAIGRSLGLASTVTFSSQEAIY